MNLCNKVLYGDKKCNVRTADFIDMKNVNCIGIIF